MIQARPRYQVGYIAEGGYFVSIKEVEPFQNIWDAIQWRDARKGNPDGWVPAFSEYWEVFNLPDPIIHV